MCAHNVSGHGYWLSGRTHTIIIDIQARARPNKFHHLTCESVRTQCEWAWYLAVRPYVHHRYRYIVTNIQTHARPNKFHHLTYLREARFAHQLMLKQQTT